MLGDDRPPSSTNSKSPSDTPEAAAAVAAADGDADFGATGDDAGEGSPLSGERRSGPARPEKTPFLVDRSLLGERLPALLPSRSRRRRGMSSSSVSYLPSSSSVRRLCIVRGQRSSSSSKSRERRDGLQPAGRRSSSSLLSCQRSRSSLALRERYLRSFPLCMSSTSASLLSIRRFDLDGLDRRSSSSVHRS